MWNGVTVVKELSGEGGREVKNKNVVKSGVKKWWLVVVEDSERE